jgi:NAD(P)-dependent dehydrogenase (short-subunit alcohol dehydrogenase family)
MSSLSHAQLKALMNLPMPFAPAAVTAPRLSRSTSTILMALPASRALEERYRRLDVLISNAGLLGPISPLADIDPRDFERALRINVTANLQLIRCMDPLLRASDAGRVVIVSTAAIHNARTERGTYTSSKAALELIGRTYANETATTRVRVNMVNPGATRTRMRAEFMPGEDPTAHPLPDRVANAIVQLCLPSLEATGRIYDVPTDRFMDFRRPA